LPPLVEMLKCDDSKIILVALEGIENILKVNNANLKYPDIVEECGGVDQMEILQRHENEEIFKKAQQVLSTYFDVEDDETDSSLAPKMNSSATQYTFGSNTNTNNTNNNNNSWNWGNNNNNNWNFSSTNIPEVTFT